jgi:RNA polymerase sigma factor (sigma-70 family)
MKLKVMETKVPFTESDRDAAILHDLDLVRTIAKSLLRRLPRCVAFDDLVSAGVLGLIQAVDRFDRAMALNFRTYAKFRIRGAMLDFLREEDPLSRSERLRLRESPGHLSATGHGVSFVTYSLTAISECALDRLTPSTPPAVLLRSEVRQARQCLSPKENRVIELLFDFDLARAEVAALFHVDQSRISQIKQGALQKMRHFLQGGCLPLAA